MKSLVITLLVLIGGLVAGSVLLPNYVHAVDVITPSKVCDKAGSSAVCQDAPSTNNARCANASSGCNPLFGSNGVITIVIRVLGFIIGFIAVVMIIASGLKMILAGGDAASLKEARSTLAHALGALLVAVLAEAIVGFILNQVP